MRKTFIQESEFGGRSSSPGSWYDLEKVATIELSSEDPQHPIEHAIRTDSEDGWRASSPGKQLLRLRFDSPLAVKRIRLCFREEEVERSQEIALFVTANGLPRREIVRQQWNFSPHGSNTEIENYSFNFHDLSLLELEVDPGRENEEVFASLQLIQIG